jgi:hypothetical protein
MSLVKLAAEMAVKQVPRLYDANVAMAKVLSFRGMAFSESSKLVRGVGAKAQPFQILAVIAEAQA